MSTQQLANPEGAFGYTAAVDVGNHVQPLESAESTTTISKGQVVTINTAGKILQATTTVDQKLQIGIAAEDIAAGEVGLVTILGLQKSVKAEGAIAAGALVTRSGTTAGSVASFTPAAVTDIGKVIGVAAAAAASSLVDLWVCRS